MKPEKLGIITEQPTEKQNYNTITANTGTSIHQRERPNNDTNTQTTNKQSLKQTQFGATIHKAPTRKVLGSSQNNKHILVHHQSYTSSRVLWILL